VRTILGIRTRYLADENVGLQVKIIGIPCFCLNTSVGFGFLASKEVKEAGVGNLGLQDREPIYFPLHSTTVINGS